MELAYNIAILVWAIMVLLYFGVQLWRYRQQLDPYKLLPVDEEQVNKLKQIWLVGATVTTAVIAVLAAHKVAYLLFPAVNTPQFLTE